MKSESGMLKTEIGFSGGVLLAGPKPFCIQTTVVSLNVYVCIVVIVICQDFSNLALLFVSSAVRWQEHFEFELM